MSILGQFVVYHYPFKSENQIGKSFFQMSTGYIIGTSSSLALF